MKKKWTSWIDRRDQHQRRQVDGMVGPAQPGRVAIGEAHSMKTSTAVHSGMVMKKLRRKLSMFWLLNQNTSEG